jgi:cyclopropane fatty-acyl-phospholipid synthase-like methyltransferase
MIKTVGAQQLAEDLHNAALLLASRCGYRPARRQLEARKFVRTDFATGKAQLELLKLAGARPSSQVLEVGCGALHASIPIIGFLDAGRFVAVDPDVELREAYLNRRRVRSLIGEKRPIFLATDDFDASALGVEFDYVISHSILTHAASWQLPQFLKNTGAVLAPGGRILASIRLAEGNQFGCPGNSGDSGEDHWVYPGVSWFSIETVRRVASEAGLDVWVKPEYTALMTRRRRRHNHDWLLLARQDGAT